MDLRARYRGCLLGLAVGDAVGTTVEFRARGSFPPVTDLVGGGPFGLAPGQWTDDTSMALALAASLVERGGFDAHDQLTRYVRWHRDGYLSSTGRCFDIGTTVAAALARFRATGDPASGSTDPHTAGNGCLMRLAPVPMAFGADLAQVETACAASARTTHGAAECLDASRLFGRMLGRALAGEAKEAVLRSDATSTGARGKLLAIAQGAYRGVPAARVRGSGYVVESLEAALWCFDGTTSYRDAVLAAANLGDDADTTAAIVGQLAGAHYGVEAIPGPWLDRLAMRAEIEGFADRLLDLRTRGPEAPGP